jgi:hypothetical protein
MPENLNRQPAPADQPPDAEGVKAAIRETRRRVSMAHGSTLALLGLWTAVLAGTSLLLPQACAIIAACWLCGTPVLFVAVRAWTWRRRRRANSPVGGVLASVKSPQSQPTRAGRYSMLLGFGTLFACGLLLAFKPTLGGVETRRWLLLPGAAILSAGVAYNFLSQRLWEHLALAAGLLAAGLALVLFEPPGLGYGLALAALAAGLLVSGSSLHLRWRRWVRSLPREEAAP